MIAFVLRHVFQLMLLLILPIILIVSYAMVGVSWEFVALISIWFIQIILIVVFELSLVYDLAKLRRRI